MNSNVVGHESQRRFLAKLLKQAKVPHALLFCGPTGVGKRLVAEEVTRSLFCEESAYGGCGSCQSCKLDASGNLPDHHFVDCSDKDNWNVDALRDLLYSLSLTSFGGKARVVVINDADLLSSAAQNILLKSLEEPRPNTFFTLISSSPSRLLPTIRSRCQLWHFQTLGEHEIKRILDKLDIDQADRIADLARIADGSLEGVNRLEQRIELWDSICTALTAPKEAIIHKFVANLAKEREALPEKLALLRIFARQQMLLETEKIRWAVFLENIILGEELILRRYLNSFVVLSNVFLPLTRPAPYKAMDGAADSILSVPV